MGDEFYQIEYLYRDENIFLIRSCHLFHGKELCFMKNRIINRKCLWFCLLSVFVSILLCSCQSNNSAAVDSSSEYLEIPEEYTFIKRADPVSDDDSSYTYKEFDSRLIEALNNKTEKICITNHMPPSWDYLESLEYGAFWVDGISIATQFGKLKGDTEKEVYYLCEFSYYEDSIDEIAQMKKEIDAETDRILSEVPDSQDDWVIIKSVHDSLCRLIQYDHSLELPHTHDLYGALVNHQAVCSGYASALRHVLTKLGIYTPISVSETHAWNHCSVMSYDQYIDVTWDDYDMSDANGDPYIMYDYLFIKREEITAIEGHDIFSGDPYITYVDEEIPYNYYAHEGYLLDAYDKDSIVQIFLSQFEAGSNCLRIRFSNKDAYEQAKNWISDDPSELYDILSSIGYHGGFYRWNNDDLNTYTIGLYPPE
jgi:hypothetical protein